MAVHPLRNEILKSLAAFSSDIKIAHSIFALPFAVVGLVLSGAGWPTASQSVLLLVAMVSARSFAMGINRWLDSDIDALNQRTVIRAIPAGRLSRREALLISLSAGAVLIVTASLLSPLCGILSLPLLFILGFYSRMKRISFLTHFYLGFCLAMAPVAVSVALTGKVGVATLLVAAAVIVWTAGFDILYSLQDRTFDGANGLYSIPARFGAQTSLWISRVCFCLMILFLALAGQFARAGAFWHLALLGVSGLLFWEHWILRDHAEQVDGRLIDKAFFTANAWVSMVFCCGVLLDLFVRTAIQ